MRPHAMELLTDRTANRQRFPGAFFRIWRALYTVKTHIIVGQLVAETPWKVRSNLSRCKCSQKPERPNQNAKLFTHWAASS